MTVSGLLSVLPYVRAYVMLFANMLDKLKCSQDMSKGPSRVKLGKVESSGVERPSFYTPSFFDITTVVFVCFLSLLLCAHN